MKILKLLVATIVAAVALAACGGGNGEVAPFSGSSSGGTGSSATPAAITLTSDSSAILSNGSTTATITVVAVDSGNVVLPNALVTLSADSGALSVGQAKTDVNGKVTATLSTGGNPTQRTITVTAKSGSLTKTVQVLVIPPSGSVPVTSLTVESSASSILTDGSKTATITAYARDASNNLLPNVAVVFSATSGGIAATNSVTDAGGAARAVLSTAGDSTSRTITVTAKSGSLTATVNVSVVPPKTALTVQMGSGFGASFVAGKIAAASTSLSAGGSTSLQVTLQQSDGTLYTESVKVTFNSPCAAQGRATLTPSVTTTTGVATATYAASGCTGSDTVTATATVGTDTAGQQLSAQVTLTVQPASIGSIVFLSATPQIISLKGISSTGVPATSIVKFQVQDQNGSPRSGVKVNFTLNTTLGGICLQQDTTCVTATSATSDATGIVQVVVVGGTAATPVRVIATVDPAVASGISTQSSQLIVSTGIATQNGFTLSVQQHNVEALDVDGVKVPVTAFLSDRYNNPVPDGTAVSFHTNGGQIEGSCTTKVVNGSSQCVVNWTSQNPRPPVGPLGVAGKAALLAVAIGEESFTDVNGNGVFDAGTDLHVPWFDLGERFLDENLTGSYVLGEYFYDFNRDGLRNDADGKFNGVLCNDPNVTGLCGTPTTGIGAKNVIIMSGSTPAGISPPAGSTLKLASTTPGTFSNFTFIVADRNGNPMPKGTTITVKLSSNATATADPLTLAAPTEPLEVPDTVVPTPIGVSIGNTNNSGILTLTFETPAGVKTILTYSVSP